jgi:solute carrier family 8 (sodium/calcium exchanger)
LVFEHGEISKIIAISIIDDLKAEKDESFAVELYDPTDGAQIGKHKKIVVTIMNDDGKTHCSWFSFVHLVLEYKTIANKMVSMVQVDIDKLSVTKTSWGQQFHNAMNVNGGDLETAKFSHYIGHTLAFFWKVIDRCIHGAAIMDSFCICTTDRHCWWLVDILCLIVFYCHSHGRGR